MSNTLIGTLLPSSRTADIIAFVVENPCCSRSDVYRELGRSSMIRRKIESLVDSVMLSETVVDGRSLLEPTGRGSRIASVLMDLEAILADVSEPLVGSDDLPLTSGSPSHRPHGSIPDQRIFDGIDGHLPLEQGVRKESQPLFERIVRADPVHEFDVQPRFNSLRNNFRGKFSLARIYERILSHTRR